jgi:dihydrofolate synthase/folylpolyglutamate synthase
MDSRRTPGVERLFALEALGIKMGLENITRLCQALDHPERSFTAIHVAGTNGKGSVTAMVHAALVAAGVRAARYISPHLVHLNERFVIGDEAVDSDALEDAATLVLDRAAALRADGSMLVAPTFFEATTTVAFELFRRAGVEVAVIEVGLGGRFDATNVLSPCVGAITSIGLDHQQYLGNTVEAIAREKAGIIKAGMTIVAGAMPGGALAAISRVAAERHATVMSATEGTAIDATTTGGLTSLTARTPVDRYGPLTLALRGEHQVGNALVALRVLETVRAAAGVALPRAAIEQGLSNVSWPARLEVVPLGAQRVLLDAAHNVDGALALAAYLKRWHPERPALVIGVMGDKDIGGILAALLPVTSAVIATEAPTPRALPAAEIARQVAAADRDRVVGIETDPERALDRALGTAATVCVAGSVFLAGAVREPLRRRAILR